MEPPWIKYPDIPRYSIGWRMGSGEEYMHDFWGEWRQGKSTEELVEHFRQYIPLPPNWLDWVALQFGHRDVIEDMFSGQGEFAGIRWLEQQGLAKFSEFMEWYEQSGFKPQG